MNGAHLTVLVLLGPCAALAQTPAREAAIARIEQAYAQTSLLAPDSPFTERLLGGAKSANPQVSEEGWAAITPEVTAAVSAVMTDKGGLVDSLVRASVAALSDPELKRLLAIYEDPVFRKMQRAMASSTTQHELSKAMWGDTVRISGAINGVLTRHGLREVH